MALHSVHEASGDVRYNCFVRAPLRRFDRLALDGFPMGLLHGDGFSRESFDFPLD